MQCKLVCLRTGLDWTAHVDVTELSSVEMKATMNTKQQCKENKAKEKFHCS